MNPTNASSHGLRWRAAVPLLIVLLVIGGGVIQAIPSLIATTASGGVQRFTVGVSGQVDGVVLDDGTKIHWDPIFSDQILKFVAISDRIQVTGRRMMTPRKESVFEATSITNLLSGKSLNLRPLPPPEPAVEKPRPPRP